MLYSNALVSNDFNWTSKPLKELEFNCMAKFRYRQVAVPVKVYIREGNQIYIEFDEKQRAVTVGQYVVLYDNENCLGGGTIDVVLKNT